MNNGSNFENLSFQNEIIEEDKKEEDKKVEDNNIINDKKKQSNLSNISNIKNSTNNNLENQNDNYLSDLMNNVNLSKTMYNKEEDKKEEDKKEEDKTEEDKTEEDKTKDEFNNNSETNNINTNLENVDISKSVFPDTKEEDKKEEDKTKDEFNNNSETNNINTNLENVEISKSVFSDTKDKDKISNPINPIEFLKNTFKDIKDKINIYKSQIDKNIKSILEKFKEKYDVELKNKTYKTIIGHYLYIKHKENKKFSFIKNNSNKNIFEKCQICEEYIIDKKLINLISKNSLLNSYNSNYCICEKCFNKNIKFIASSKIEKYALFLNEKPSENKNNNNFKVNWGTINNEEYYKKEFLYGFIKPNFNFSVNFEILGDPPSIFKLQKQGGLGTVVIKNENKKNSFTQEFHLNDIDKLYPGIYRKYIYLMDNKNNKSDKKYFDIVIYCEKKKK